jgi:predicted O-methyltransferase YrrM
MTVTVEKIRTSIRRTGIFDTAKQGVRWAYHRYRAADPALQNRVKTHNDGFFADLGIRRADAERLYRDAAAKVGFTPGENDSIHRLAFAALATSGFEPANILELGTSHGETTAYLAEIFPEARITTIELPDEDPLYDRMHPRQEVRKENVERRLASPKITQIRTNTVFLQDLGLPDFDLIWLDAGHHFPEVAWDHFFCMHKLAPGGWLLTDDVMLPDNPLARTKPNILDVWKVVDYYNQRNKHQFRLLLKRESVRQYLMNIKYVGAYHKRSGAAANDG